MRALHAGLLLTGLALAPLASHADPASAAAWDARSAAILRSAGPWPDATVATPAPVVVRGRFTLGRLPARWGIGLLRNPTTHSEPDADSWLDRVRTLRDGDPGLRARLRRDPASGSTLLLGRLQFDVNEQTALRLDWGNAGLPAGRGWAAGVMLEYRP